MIDYVKILIKDCNVQRLTELPDLDFRGEYSAFTGEVWSTLKTKHHYCTIMILKNGDVLFYGSIHKLWNSLHDVKAPNYNPEKDYGYNGNMFTYIDIVEAREYLTSLFGCTPQQMIFQNIEFGVNTTSGIKPKLFLNGLLYHQNKGFDVKKDGNYKQVEHEQYRLKIYSKSKQYNLKTDTLRVEIRVKKSEYLIKRTGVKTFADISPDTLNKAKNMLLEAFNKVAYYDYTINKDKLKERTKTALIKYSNPNYWLNELKPNHRDRHRKRLEEIIQNHSDNLRKKIVNNINEKCVTNDRLSEPKKCVTNDRLFEDEKNQKCVTNDTYRQGDIYYTLTNIQNTKKRDKKCLITGVDISMQKEGSFLLSHTGLKWYYKHDLKTFDKISKKYLSKKWQEANFKTQIKELAHNIRNYQNNRKLKQQRLYPENEYLLFDINELCV